MPQDPSPSPNHALPVLALLALILFLSYEGLRPPAPLPANAPATEFSAARARDVLNLLVGDGIPHPTGSAQDDVVRGRVLDEFTKLGYQPAVQTGFACDDMGDCATVQNVLARLDGSAPGPAVLLAAHYDSVPAGPGAFDDGAGAAAVLEIARAFKSLPQPLHSIIFLIDDGEEAGMLGARVFVNQHPWAKDVRAVVNIDSRGTSGPSLMFETGDANQWAVRLYARHARHPATSSIFYTAYKQIPADTDFTVFKAAGYQGLNFANINNVVHYHTPLDNFENADPATLQHQGDNALSSLEALANADISNPPKSESVYFDLLGRWTVRWPATRTLQIALAAAFLLLLEIVWLLYKKRLTVAGFLWGFVAWLVSILAVAVCAFLLSFILRKAGAMPVAWTAHPLPIRIAFWSLAMAVLSFCVLRFASRAGFLGLWAGVWSWWALLSITLAVRTSGVSYILQTATCAAALAGLLLVFRPKSPALAAILPLAVSTVVGFPVALLLYHGFGNHALPLIAVLVGLLLSPLAPLCAYSQRARGISWLALPWLALALAALASFAAIVAPAYSAKAPEHVNLQYVQEADSGRSQWVVYPASGRLPEPIRLATNFHASDGGVFPWILDPAFFAAAPHLELAPPTFTILESSQLAGKRRFRTLLRSERGASEAIVMFPPDSRIESVLAEDEPVQPETDRIRQYTNGWYAYDFYAMPAKGVEVSFTLPVGKSVEVYALDVTYALPLEGMFLLKSRPLTATPFGEGDCTIASRRVQLLP
ncbi:MAG: M20/M25/M40 family metallo-hydrolase [Candidatus Acidiferrales bacterium]